MKGAQTDTWQGRKSGKTAKIMSEIARLVSEGCGDTILLVPEQYSHEAEKELARACGDALSLYGEVLSFTGLAGRVEAESGFSNRMLDKGGRLLALALCGKRNRLKAAGFFRGPAQAPTC